MERVGEGDHPLLAIYLHWSSGREGRREGGKGGCVGGPDGAATLGSLLKEGGVVLRVERKGGREGGSGGEREWRREGGREGVEESMREAGKEAGIMEKGKRKKGREGGREGGRERPSEGNGEVPSSLSWTKGSIWMTRVTSCSRSSCSKAGRVEAGWSGEEGAGRREGGREGGRVGGK